MGMNGDYLTMAQAVGDEPDHGLSFSPQDFDPYDDPDETREIIGLAMERDMAARDGGLRRELERANDEIARLRDLLEYGDE